MNNKDNEQNPISQNGNETQLGNVKSHLGIENQLFNARNSHKRNEPHVDFVKFRDLNNSLISPTGPTSGLKYAGMERFKGNWVYAVSPQEKAEMAKWGFIITVVGVLLYVIASFML